MGPKQLSTLTCPCHVGPTGQAWEGRWGCSLPGSAEQVEHSFLAQHSPVLHVLPVFSIERAACPVSSLPRTDKVHKGSISLQTGAAIGVLSLALRGLGTFVNAVLETSKVKAPMELGPHPLYTG